MRSFPEDVFVDEEEGMEVHIPPRPAANCIPFPQTEDFCSTAPQDSLHLFVQTDSDDLQAAEDDTVGCFDASREAREGGCNTFAFALDITGKSKAQARPPFVRRVGNTRLYECEGWIVADPLSCQ